MQVVPTVLGWLLSAAMLLAEHIGMWDQPWRLREPYTYIVGVATLACGWITWGVTATGPVSPIDAVANICAVSSSGVVVAVAYYVRARLGRHLDRAQQQGEVIGMARGIRQSLTQEMIDRGENEQGRSN